MNKNLKFKIINSKGGFTLIEVIVVIAVFLLVISASVTIFISIIQNQKKILFQQQLLNQASYSMEKMSKALRVAKKSVTLEDQTCIPAGYFYLLTKVKTDSEFYNGIKFLNQSDSGADGNPTCTEYYLDSKGVLRETTNDFSLAANGYDNESSTPLMSENLKIRMLRFGINGMDGKTASCENPQRCGASDDQRQQPRVTMVMSFQDQKGENTINLQTTVSQRNLNAN